ncbi:MAG: TonB family protein [Candidatus Acidiferrales bacterium]
MTPASASFRPGRGLTTALTIVLGLGVLLNLAFAFVAGWIVYVFHALASETPLAYIPFSFIGRWLGWDQASGFGGFFFPLPILWPWRDLAALTSTILFMIWLYRAHKNLTALGVEPLRYRSHWAITGYFVPFLNLVRPFQMVREVWKGSSGTAPEQPTASLVRVWWELTLLTAILANLNSYIETANRVKALGLVVACYLVTATVLVAQLLLVRRIHRWQLERAGQAAPAGRGEPLTVWTSPLVDLGAVAGVVLVAALLYWHSGRVVDAAAERWMERLEAARPQEPPPPPPEPSAGGDDKGAAFVAPKEIEGVQGGVPGGVEGGVEGGVVGGVPGGIPSSPPASAPKQIRASQSVSASKRIGGSPPKYPELARRARIQGTVTLEVIIGTDGRVNNIRVQSGHPMLIQAAVDAVKTWKYTPTMMNGQPVEVLTTVVVIFRLEP